MTAPFFTVNVMVPAFTVLVLVTVAPSVTFWFDPLKEDLEAFIGKIQERVSGSVTLRLQKGSCVVVGRESEWALYNEDLASFDSKTFDQSESLGMVKTHGMQSRMYWALRQGR